MTTPTLPSACEAIEGCSLPIDVVLQSSDGRLLGAHSKNLEWFADGFPLSGSTSPSEIVPLTDKGDTLLLFLKFTHNHPAPDLSLLSIGSLLDLAEVANKYCNYFALGICRQPMRVLAQESAETALKILRFKAIHHDFEEIDNVAAKTVDFTSLHVLKFFGSNYTQQFAVWLQFQHRWKEFIPQYHSQLRNMVFDCSGRVGRNNDIDSDDDWPSPCSSTRSLLTTHRAALEQEIPTLQRFDSRFNGLVPCRAGCQALHKWCESVRATLRTAPTWQEFLAW
ncbi:hypothetical protein L218DRAFT_737719 [Marasmius fiardii PR-910]|nr:hypothetical protein L218DRAFT_737719 [Marasmius fiardii PR-910]